MSVIVSHCLSVCYSTTPKQNGRDSESCSFEGGHGHVKMSKKRKKYCNHNQTHSHWSETGQQDRDGSLSTLTGGAGFLQHSAGKHASLLTKYDITRYNFSKVPCHSFHSCVYEWQRDKFSEPEIFRTSQCWLSP